MTFITLEQTNKFKNISGDKNKIHTDEKIANKFFFRKPIVHGINLFNLALLKFFHRKKILLNYEVLELTILFKNFCLINEKVDFILNKNKFLVKGKFNEKIVVYIKLKKKKIKNIKLNKFSKKIINFYKLKKNINLVFLLNHLIRVSKIAGNHKPYNRNLINSISLRKNNKFIFSKKRIRKITKNIYMINYADKFYVSNTVISKLTQLSLDKNKFNLNNKIGQKIKKKKLLFFGYTSDLAQATLLFFKKFKPKIFSFSLNNFNTNLKKNQKKLTDYILKIKPDFIFYFSSPKIITEVKKGLYFKQYNDVYYRKFRLVLNIIKKNKLSSFIFYPSSIFLDSKKYYSKFESYIKAKEKAEGLYKLKSLKKYFKFYRLPKFKTRSTYSLLGYYSGIDLVYLKKYLEKFLTTTNR